MHFSEPVFLPRLLAHQLHIWLLRGDPAESPLDNWTEIKEQKLTATGVAIVLVHNAVREEGEKSPLAEGVVSVQLLCKHIGECWLLVY